VIERIAPIVSDTARIREGRPGHGRVRRDGDPGVRQASIIEDTHYRVLHGQEEIASTAEAPGTT